MANVDVLNNVGYFLASAAPWLSSSIAVEALTGTIAQVTFPGVTRFVTIKNTVSILSPIAPLRVGFSANGVQASPNNNYLVLSNGESHNAPWKVTDLFLLGDTAIASTAEVVAGITSLPTTVIVNNWTGTAGVG
tara:strand:+ start:1754 stop:2155 length:402 start_codon:yes stop_codon:yes gene_type:complete